MSAGTVMGWRRWCWILFLSFIAFWPILGGINQTAEGGCEGPRYGRDDDLSQIGKAMYAYTENNDGRLPPSLWTLYPAYIPNTRLLVSPADIIDPQNSGGFLDRYIYLYEGGANMKDLQWGDPIVVYPYKVSEDTTWCDVLFCDGHVRNYSFSQFLDEWASSHERGRR